MIDKFTKDCMESFPHMNFFALECSVKDDLQTRFNNLWVTLIDRIPTDVLIAGLPQTKDTMCQNDTQFENNVLVTNDIDKLSEANPIMSSSANTKINHMEAKTTCEDIIQYIIKTEINRIYDLIYKNADLYEITVNLDKHPYHIINRIVKHFTSCNFCVIRNGNAHEILTIRWK